MKTLELACKEYINICQKIDYHFAEAKKCLCHFEYFTKYSQGSSETARKCFLFYLENRNEAKRLFAEKKTVRLLIKEIVNG